MELQCSGVLAVGGRRWHYLVDYNWLVGCGKRQEAATTRPTRAGRTMSIALWLALRTTYPPCPATVKGNLIEPGQSLVFLFLF